MGLDNYLKLSITDIDKLFQNHHISSKTISNYRGRINRYLSIAQKDDIKSPQEAIDEFFSEYQKKEASDAVFRIGRFSLRTLFKLMDDNVALTYLDDCFQKNSKFQLYLNNFNAAMVEHGEGGTRLNSYRPVLTRLLHHLPCNSEDWTAENIRYALQTVTGQPENLPKSCWYFLLFAAGRKDLVHEFKIRFTPPLPATQKKPWDIIVNKKTGSVVRRRIYNRSAGLAYSWLKMSAHEEFPLREEKKNELIRYVLGQTGNSNQRTIIRSLNFYLEMLMTLRRGV